MTVRTNIATGLKTARKAAGLNVDEVGAAIGKSGKTISAWEVGRGQPDGDELILLCKLLGAHLRDFYGDEYADLISNTVGNQSLSPEERELVECYRATRSFGKRALLSTARMYRDELGDDEGPVYLTADMPPYEMTAEDYEWLAQDARRRFEEGEV